MRMQPNSIISLYSKYHLYSFNHIEAWMNLNEKSKINYQYLKYQNFSAGTILNPSIIHRIVIN